MAWDKNLPAGGNDIALGDDAIRANNAAIETAVGREHEFSTGGTNSGRHAFLTGNNATRDAISNWVAGSIYFNTEVRSGAICMQRYSGTAWVDLDVFQSTLPRLNAQSQWTVAQFAAWASVTPGAGSPDTLAIDLSLSPNKYATIVGDTIISNPTNAVASHGTVVRLILTMSGAGHVITWGNNYRFANGVEPVVASANGAKTCVYIESQQDGTYLASTAPNVSA